MHKSPKNKKDIVIVCRASQGGAYVYSMKFLRSFLKYFSGLYNVIYVGPVLDGDVSSQVKHIKTRDIRVPLLQEILFFFFFTWIVLKNFSKKNSLIISHSRVLVPPGFRIWSIYHSLHFQQLWLAFNNKFMRLLYFFYHFFYSLFDLINIFSSDKNFFINPSNALIRLFPNNFYIPNFINTELFQPISSDNKSYFNILFIGRNDFAKGIVETVNTINLCRQVLEENFKKSICITVICPTSTPIPGVDRQIASVKNSDMPSLINFSDLLINSSLHENVSTTLLEAMSCQKIVLSKNVGYLPKIIAFPEFQIYSKDHELIDKLLRISRLHENTLEEIGTRNRDLVLEFFSLESIYEFFSRQADQI